MPGPHPQAIAMDSCNADGLTSSMADDIFFVLQKCARYCDDLLPILAFVDDPLPDASLNDPLYRRAFASANVDGACAMLNHARYR